MLKADVFYMIREKPVYLKTSFSWIESVFMSLFSQGNHTYDSFCLNTLFNTESYYITRSENLFLHYFRTCGELKGDQLTARDSGSKGSSMMSHLNTQKALLYFSSAGLTRKVLMPSNQSKELLPKFSCALENLIKVHMLPRQIWGGAHNFAFVTFQPDAAGSMNSMASLKSVEAFFI